MTGKKKTETALPASGLRRELKKRGEFDDPRQEAYLNLVRSHSLLASQFAQLFKKHGISDPQYNALRILKGHGEPMHIHQIAERMVAAQTDISRLISRLDTAGLVKRRQCASDRRVFWISLTARGKALLKKLEKPVAELHGSQFSRLSVKEMRKLNDLLFKARQE
ncbi:MAG: MarR family transcriptional regulator [Planctomycetota bacterium]